MHFIASTAEKTKSWLMNSLGNRRSLPGFIQSHSSKIALIYMIAPIIISTTAFAWNHGHEIPEKLRQARQWVLKQIVPPEQLTRREVIAWYAKKVGKILLAAAMIAIAVVAVYALAKLGIFHMMAQSAWLFLKKLSIVRAFLSAFESPNSSIVCPGYFCIALAHLYQAKRSFDKGEKMMMIKNIFAAAISLVTIGAMLTGLYEARWHHMSYGLLTMLPSSFTLNVFGGLMTADSMLYWIKPLKDDYDFSNIFEENAKLFVIQLICMTALEWAAKSIFSKTHPGQTREMPSL